MSWISIFDFWHDLDILTKNIGKMPKVESGGGRVRSVGFTPKFAAPRGISAR
jgi:hypothetical protein